ncbi:hypothetical protein Taro_055375 [Colocasia esculenta]|uniref:Uncharacterized protein n=1 Tax=Colocasia esculenta TaxID=4460 RepID=A0A843XR47_COLES|nr:hypothetical protein [Colocasia esculenta]
MAPFLPCRLKPLTRTAVLLYRFLHQRVHPFCVQLCYFLSLSAVGFLLLKTIPPKWKSTAVPQQRPSDLDLFFTSVSAVTVSSMSTVEMEFFSNAQLVVLTVLMLVGAEPFTSLLGLLLRKLQLEEDQKETSMTVIEEHGPEATSSNHIELGLMVWEPEIRVLAPTAAAPNKEDVVKPRAVRCLALVVLGYITVINVMGSSLVLLYLVAVPSAGGVLTSKNIPLLTFSVFTVVSSFSNCGFVPNNENMIAFRKHPGLLLLVAAVILAGNTLYPPLLRSVIWALGRAAKRRPAATLFKYLLRKHVEVGSDHLLSARRCVLLSLTVAGLLLVQLVLFCSMEWGSEGLEGMSAYQKLVGAVFMSVNSRHAGEFVVDISSVSSAVLVLYVVMMYLPPYTTFMLVKHDDQEAKSVDVSGKEEKRRKALMESLVFSHLCYLAVFTILVCITEREQLTRDPLNFNVLYIVIEVVSAYGNVGFSTGYSCARRLRKDGECRDMSYGFAGRWSSEGKLLLICVMFFGRLKRVSMDGGKAWILG